MWSRSARLIRPKRIVHHVRFKSIVGRLREIGGHSAQFGAGLFFVAFCVGAAVSYQHTIGYRQDLKRIDVEIAEGRPHSAANELRRLMASTQARQTVCDAVVQRFEQLDMLNAAFHARMDCYRQRLRERAYADATQQLDSAISLRRRIAADPSLSGREHEVLVDEIADLQTELSGLEAERAAKST